MTTKEQIKNTGATFTPKELSDFLAERLTAYATSSKQAILDPACGDGELLVAIGDKLTHSNINFTLTGYDANAEYLSFAKERTLRFGAEKTNFISGDFLQAIDITQNQGVLDLFSNKKSEMNAAFDIVIANPPYVRTQILEIGRAHV